MIALNSSESTQDQNLCVTSTEPSTCDKTIGLSTLIGLVYDRVSNANMAIGRREVNIIISSLLNHLETAISQGENVKLRGFGTFVIKKRRGRPNARNPKTGIIYPTKDHYAIVFRPSQKLKKNVQCTNPYSY